MSTKNNHDVPFALNELCQAFASADTQEDAIAAAPGWVRTVLGAPQAGIRISVADAAGRLRVACAVNTQMDEVRRRSARRREVFVTRAAMSLRLFPDRTLVMQPLVARGECLGVLEVVAPSANLYARRGYLSAVTSQLAISLGHLRREERLRRDLQAVRKAVSMGRAVSSARSVEAALRAAARFVAERFQTPVAVWCGSDVSPDLRLVDVSGTGHRKRRELRAALPSLSSDPRERITRYDAPTRDFTRILGLEEAELIDVGGAVMMVGAPAGRLSTDTVLPLLEEALRVRAGRTANAPTGGSSLDLAWTAHELKRPLLGVKAALEMLVVDSADEVSDRDRQLLIGSLAELEDLSTLVDGLLGWLGGRQPLDLSDVDVVELVDDVVAAQRGEDVAQRIVVHAPPAAFAYIDPVQFGTAVANILRNAFSYASPGSKVEISIDRHDGSITIAIHNEGRSLVAADESIFDPFVRGDASGRYPGGSGLGLFIARQVMVAHGGRIWFEADQEGTTFFLRVDALPEGR